MLTEKNKENITKEIEVIFENIHGKDSITNMNRKFIIDDYNYFEINTEHSYFNVDFKIKNNKLLKKSVIIKNVLQEFIKSHS